MTKIGDSIKNIMKTLNIERKQISQILIKKDVVESIIDFANSAYPREFMAILEGEVMDTTLVVNGLIYQPFQSANNSSIMRINLPLLTKAVGSVHSHPSGNVSPSKADLFFFAKNGSVHLIIGYPFNGANIACYAYDGTRIECRFEN